MNDEHPDILPGSLQPGAVYGGWGAYAASSQPTIVIKEIKRISTPGRRVYSSVRDLPTVANGLGVSILSTPKGVMSDSRARTENVGGEILCSVF